VENGHHVLAGAGARYGAPLIHAHTVPVAASIDRQLGHTPTSVGAHVEREESARKYFPAGSTQYGANVVAAHGVPTAIGLEHKTRHTP